MLQRRILHPTFDSAEYSSTLPPIPPLPPVRTSLTCLGPGPTVPYLASTVSSPSKPFHPQLRYLPYSTSLPPYLSPIPLPIPISISIPIHTSLLPSTLVGFISPHPPPPSSHQHKQHIGQLESYTPLRHPTPRHPPNHNASTQPLHREVTTQSGYSESFRGLISNVSLSFAARSHIFGPIVSISHRQSDIPCHLIFNITADILSGTR